MKEKSKEGNSQLVMPTTKEVFAETITKIAETFEFDLYEKEKHELEGYWHFKWDDQESIEWNVYQFHDLLGLYGSFCRRWEEKHNDSCCVVERVRDQYLWPKISAFVARFTTAVGSGLS